jgi:hypothetical protein
MAALVAGLTLAGCDMETAGMGGAPRPSSTGVLTAEELRQAFALNEVSAAARFDGQALKVSGAIEAIELDIMDNPVVRLKTAEPFSTVAATFPKEAKGRIGGLAQGQEITVLCMKVTEVIGMPLLDECEIR